MFIQGTNTADYGIDDCHSDDHNHDEDYDDEDDGDDDESDTSVAFSPSL